MTALQTLFVGITRLSVRFPKQTLWLVGLITLVLLSIPLVLAVNPALISSLQPLTIDTDPENMLRADEPARVTHNELKSEFEIYDFVAVGIVTEADNGEVFNQQTLARVHALSDHLQGLPGVVKSEFLSLVTVDRMTPLPDGDVEFDLLMTDPPQSEEAAQFIKREMLRIPTLKNTLAAEDGSAVAILATIEDKSYAGDIYREARAFTADWPASDQVHIGGLPVAEDVFGIEMFIQMAFMAPLAMLLVFILMVVFFRRLSVATGPLIVAFVSVIWTMSLLVISGHTVHIMSSMIPIFVMTIAVLDSVHYLSEFHDRYAKAESRPVLLTDIAKTLFTPMVFTTLTSAVGFASLAFAPIPPIQVFGLYVAIGIAIAWLLTISVLPAYLQLLSGKTLAGLGTASSESKPFKLIGLGRAVNNNSRLVTIVFALLTLLAAIGLFRIVVNDNPVRWFGHGHPLRVADTTLNEHLGGTYTAYLALEGGEEDVFKQPDVLNYISQLQSHIEKDASVGKTSGVVQIVKTVHRDLFDGNEAEYRIPDSPEAVAQVLLIFQNSHRAGDLSHYVTPAFDKLNIWIQMRSGDNQDMSRVVESVDQWLHTNTPPAAIVSKWFGLNYVNMIWQDKMVSGMMTALITSFAVVFVLMVVLFRSVVWGIVCMLPLTVTIVLIYGLLGWTGKFYDMPVAVLSSLSLGLAVDYAIHFISQTRAAKQHGDRSWQQVLPEIFSEPVNAIFRNMVVLGVGFTPLLLSPLVPYNTVGLLIASILLLAGLATLLLLPACIRLLEPGQANSA